MNKNFTPSMHAFAKFVVLSRNEDYMLLFTYNDTEVTLRHMSDPRVEKSITLIDVHGDEISVPLDDYDIVCQMICATHMRHPY